MNENAKICRLMHFKCKKEIVMAAYDFNKDYFGLANIFESDSSDTSSRNNKDPALPERKMSTPSTFSSLDDNYDFNLSLQQSPNSNTLSTAILRNQPFQIMNDSVPEILPRRRAVTKENGKLTDDTNGFNSTLQQHPNCNIIPEETFKRSPSPQFNETKSETDVKIRGLSRRELSTSPTSAFQENWDNFNRFSPIQQLLSNSSVPSKATFQSPIETMPETLANGRAILGRKMPTFSSQENGSLMDNCYALTPSPQQHYSLPWIVKEEVSKDSLYEKKSAVDKIAARECEFCQKNGESREFYTTHVLKDSKDRVICPVLRNYVCPLCSATGDKAHTIRHCPQHKDVASMADAFKTRRTSCGIRKRNPIQRRGNNSKTYE